MKTKPLGNVAACGARPFLFCLVRRTAIYHCHRRLIAKQDHFSSYSYLIHVCSDWFKVHMLAPFPAILTLLSYTPKTLACQGILYDPHYFGHVVVRKPYTLFGQPFVMKLYTFILQTYFDHYQQHAQPQQNACNSDHENNHNAPPYPNRSASSKMNQRTYFIVSNFTPYSFASSSQIGKSCSIASNARRYARSITAPTKQIRHSAVSQSPNLSAFRVSSYCAPFMRNKEFLLLTLYASSQKLSLGLPQTHGLS